VDKAKVRSAILGFHLRDLRKSKGVASVIQLSKLMERKYSYSNISRREKGLIKIDAEYLNAFSTALNLSEEEKSKLITSARVNLLQNKGKYSDSISEWLRISLGAKYYQTYNASVISFHQRTHAYSFGMARSRNGQVDENAIAARVNMAEEFARDKNKKLRIICHENAFYYPVGSSEVMIEQLDKLLRFVDEPHAEFRALPKESFTGVFCQLSFHIIDNNYFCCENSVDLSITDDPSIVSKFQTDFDLLWENSVIGLRREQMIREAIAHYKNLV
jgi:hypothetical protein